MVRRLGVIDLILITIGAVIGSGIFRTPAIVAARAHTDWLIMACWIGGGAIALIGGMVYAELAARRPRDGGAYGYLREAFGPLIAFLVPWQCLTLSYVGSTALSAVVFATYILPLTPLHVDARIGAIAAIAFVTLVNVLGVRAGSVLQHVLVALKVLGIFIVIATGLLIAHPGAPSAPPLTPFATPWEALAAMGVAMLPVLFSYNNFQSVAFMTAETKDPGRTISRGLVAGILAIIGIYLLASYAYLHVLGAGGLAASNAPAIDVMRATFGQPGVVLVAVAIATSTLGFMSNAILLAPRVYFQMAYDDLFFKQIAYIDPRTNVPVVAIVLHGTIAALYAASGSYEQILNWISAWIWIFTLLNAIAIFIYRRQDAGKAQPEVVVPFHPWTTIVFIAAIVAIFVASFVQYPRDTLYGLFVNLAGVVFYFVWKNRRAAATA